VLCLFPFASHFVIELSQLFFGNVAQLSDSIKDVLKEKNHEGDLPIIIIIDFTLVVGMDSSAAHAIAKLKKIIHRFFRVEISLFVTGSDRGGFPCEYALSEALSSTCGADGSKYAKENVGFPNATADGQNVASDLHEDSTDHGVPLSKSSQTEMTCRVCESLDDALRYAEDILIARQDSRHHFTASGSICFSDVGWDNATAANLTAEEEKYSAKKYLKDLLESPDETSRGATTFLSRSIDLLVSMMTREEYKQEDILWEQGDDSTSLKIIVSGELLSVIDETGASERVAPGNVVGELGLVQPGTKRLTTLICASPKAILYGLDRDAWTKLKRDNPKVASLIDGLVIRYLAHRVQHVSNRYFHTTLPV
jgi:sulfate permease, SulP family